MSWVPLMRARPSLASRITGCEAGRGERLRALGHRPAAVAAGPRRRGRGRGGRGERGRRWRPPSPARGSRGARRGSASATRRSRVSGRTPQKPLARTLARSSMRPRVSASPRGSPTPAAWLRTRLSWSCFELVLRDHDVGEVAEAGGDAVDHGALGHRVVDHRAGAGHAARARRARGPPAGPARATASRSARPRLSPSSRSGALGNVGGEAAMRGAGETIARGPGRPPCRAAAHPGRIDRSSRLAGGAQGRHGGLGARRRCS